MIMTCSTTSVLYYIVFYMDNINVVWVWSDHKISDCDPITEHAYLRSLILFFDIILIFTHHLVTKNHSSLLCSFLCFSLKHKPHHKITEIPARSAVADGCSGSIRNPAGTRRLCNVMTLDMTLDRRCILVENENRVDVNIWRWLKGAVCSF